MDQRFAPALLLLVAAALAAPPADALVRCVGKDGKVTYTDGECDESQKASGVAIHDSSGMVSPKAAPKSSSGSMIPSAQPRSNVPPPPTLNTKPIPVSPLVNHPNAGVRQNARYQYEEARKAQAAENKQKMDDWKREVERASPGK
jgi:hypothetical protein